MAKLTYNFQKHALKPPRHFLKSTFTHLEAILQNNKMKIDLFRWAERYRLAEQTGKEYDWLQHLANDGMLPIKCCQTVKLC